jgi:hypothetical protein
MGIINTSELIDWLEQNHPGRKYDIAEVREILSIAMTELDVKDTSVYDSLPLSIVKEFIEQEKESGAYYRLERKIAGFIAGIDPDYTSHGE